MKIIDEKEQEYYDKVIKYLKSIFGWNADTMKSVTLNSGDNSVLMRGPFAGHSLSELKEYVAKIQEKPIEWDSEGY